MNPRTVDRIVSVILVLFLLYFFIVQLDELSSLT